MEKWEQNEIVFRAANESLERRASDALDLNAPAPFICECSDERCLELVHVPLGAYRTIHAEERRFVVLAGHDRPEERVVETHDGFVVVEKPPHTFA